MAVLIFINATIFSILAILHFYWAFGGQRFLAGSLPSYPNGRFVFKPKFISTVFVALAMIIFATITVGNAGLFDNLIDKKFMRYGSYGICLVFLLRAVGDFHFVGWGKKIKGTDFARKDTKIYSPMCLVIASISLTITFLK